MARSTSPCFYKPQEIRRVAGSTTGYVKELLDYFADLVETIDREECHGEIYPQVTVEQAFNKILSKLNAANLSNVEALQFTQAYLNLAHAKTMIENNQKPLTSATESGTLDDRIVGAFATIAAWGGPSLAGKLNECLYGTDPNAAT